MHTLKEQLVARKVIHCDTLQCVYFNLAGNFSSQSLQWNSLRLARSSPVLFTLCFDGLGGWNLQAELERELRKKEKLDQDLKESRAQLDARAEDIKTRQVHQHTTQYSPVLQYFLFYA